MRFPRQEYLDVQEYLDDMMVYKEILKNRQKQIVKKHHNKLKTKT